MPSAAEFLLHISYTFIYLHIYIEFGLNVLSNLLLLDMPTPTLFGPLVLNFFNNLVKTKEIKHKSEVFFF